MQNENVDWLTLTVEQSGFVWCCYNKYNKLIFSLTIHQQPLVWIWNSEAFESSHDWKGHNNVHCWKHHSDCKLADISTQIFAQYVRWRHRCPGGEFSSLVTSLSYWTSVVTLFTLYRYQWLTIYHICIYGIFLHLILECKKVIVRCIATWGRPTSRLSVWALITRSRIQQPANSTILLPPWTHDVPTYLNSAKSNNLWWSCCDLSRPISVCILCVFVLYCIVVVLLWARWGTWLDWSLIPWTYLSSVLWHCWLGHLTRKNPSPISPIMCLVGR